MYEQTNGVAMGSPLSPIVANIFMESFETLALNSYTLKPKVWKIFVDDTNVIWTHGNDELNKFIQHLNNQSDAIQFTLEMEEKGSIPFLDVRIKKGPDATLSRQVYRKPTHIEQYLHADSHHHPAQKLGVIKTLATRALKISNKGRLDQERKHLI